MCGRSGWVVGLKDAAGRWGWGEAAPLPDLGTEDLNNCGRWLRNILKSARGTRPESLLHALPPAPSPAPAARCGLEMALLDLLAQAEGQPLARYLHERASTAVPLSEMLGSLVEVEETAIQAARAAGFTQGKLKLGLAPPEQEQARLRALCAALPSGFQLRLDANGAWSFQTAQRFLRSLEKLPIALLEEPLHQPTPEAFRSLQRQTPIPLGMDESLRFWNRAGLALQRPPSVVLLKPQLHGGLLPSLALARQARELGLHLLTTTLVDGALGTWATAHLAAALDALGNTLPHGLATSRWLARDLAAPPEIRAGKLWLPERPGLGCAPDPTALSFPTP